jgi:Fe-S-cluster containining protein
VPACLTKKCGECCRTRFHEKLGVGYLLVWVPLTPADKERIAGHFDLSVEQFVLEYDIDGPMLKMKNGECPFLKDNLCSIHEIKPEHCARTNPCEEEK